LPATQAGSSPELTPYGRLFKMTGYTIGQRAMPISAMAVASLVQGGRHIEVG